MLGACGVARMVDGAMAFTETVENEVLPPEGSGTVKWFDPNKGYGFIKLPDGKDVFLHVKELRKSGITGLNDGAVVSFKFNKNTKGKGLFATEIKVLPGKAV
jgi:cold shock protein